ncbi:glycogenin glucosyltransferase [Mucor velutinosus]|uniref:Glycogenin glucosyltransferase n=1 Tax=Mucor velutinosus TaxID=708070 RepID=A0AAN7DGU1_9FUNG|nr:glycogenin glucosyltransferase [Mucor velutinosus]
MASTSSASATLPTICTKLDLSDSSSYLPSNLFQPRNSFFNRKQTTPGVQQLLLRRNQLDSLQTYAKALLQFKQHLTELSLRENNFSQFPIEILVLKNLTSLSLANNQLEVIHKDILSQLPNLQWLNLAHNRLTELPVDIVCCHYLRGLDLESNNFSSFPSIIFYLTRLEVLMFQKNKVKVIPPNYNFPPTLHTLNLAFNTLTQVPNTLLHQPPDALTHLHLSGNRLGQLPPKFLSCGYSKLVSLDLHTCQLTRVPSKFFERLSKCKDLRRLNLAINRLAEVPPEIGLLSQLQWLNLNDNRITHLPDTISSLTHLVKLGLVQNQLKILPPFMFLHMLELQKLDIRRNQLKYMPPSILALAPRQEVDIHVDLAVPHLVFSTLSNPPCHSNDQLGADCHPYGGSLRTLLFYENTTIEHVDGILCELDNFEDEEDGIEGVQVMSLSSAYSVLQTAQTNNKKALRDALYSKRNIPYCSDAKFRRSDHPMPNLLSEIDDEENAISGDEDDMDEEKEALKKETQRILTQVASLRETCLRTHLTHSHRYLKTNKRIDQYTEKVYDFIDSALHTTIVPSYINQYAQALARQCDYCHSWNTQSAFQIGYLARLCNNRLQIPVRFHMCSIECTLDAVIKLYQSTMDWHTRQSLAHIDATLLLPSVNPMSNVPTLVQAPPQAPPSATRSSTANRIIQSVPSVNTNYWHVGLSSSNARRASTQTNGTLGTIQNDDDVSQHDQEHDSLLTQRSRSTSSSSSTTATTLSDSTSSDDYSMAGQPSLARTIRNRVTQFASTFFIGSANSQADIRIVDQESSISNSTSSTRCQSSIQQQHQEPSHPPLSSLVLPNLNLGTTSTASSTAREFIEEEPPSIISITSRLVEGRLQTERTQPQLRLSAPTPSPTAFNHLPRDAIRLEKF